jgi:hypothetical protein
MSRHVHYPRSKKPWPSSDVWRSLARRVVSMLLLWLALGAVVGVLSAPPGGGPIGFLAGAVAGMIVLPVLGVAFGVLGGHWRATLLGASCGLVSGCAAALVVGSTRLGLSASLCLIVGACAGATFPQLCRIRCWLAGQLSAQAGSAGKKGARLLGISTVSPDCAINP